VGFDVGEGVLRDVGETAGGVAPGGALVLVGLILTDEKLDESGLAGTVGAEEGDAGGEGALDGDANDGGAGVARVGVVAANHLHESLALGLDALNVAGLGEFERKLGLLHLEEGLSFGVALDERREVALEELELVVLDLHDVGGHLVEELGVVRHDDASHVHERLEVVEGPADVHHVKMVGGLVEEEDVRLLKHSTRESELHAPATGEGGNSIIDSGASALLGSEADVNKDLADLGAGDAVVLDLLVSEHVVVARQVRLLAHNVGLDEDSTNGGGVGEALNLVLGDGLHQGGLAGVVLTEETVTAATEKLHGGVVEENLGTEGKSEGAVAEGVSIVGFLVVFLDLLGELLEEAGRDFGDLGGGGELAKEVGEHFNPLVGFTLEVINKGADAGGREVKGEGVVEAALLDVAELGLEGLEDALLVGDVVEADATELDALELLDSFLHYTTGLGIGNGVHEVVEEGDDLGEEGHSLNLVVNELCHVANNLGTKALGGGILLAETPDHEGDNGGKGATGHDSDESGTGELVDALVDLGRIPEGFDEVGKKGTDVPVIDEVDPLLEELHRGSGDLLLGVAEKGLAAGDDLGEAVFYLVSVPVAERMNGFAGGDHGPPLLRAIHAGDARGDDIDGGVAGDDLYHSLVSALGGLLYRVGLVGAAADDGKEHGNQESRSGLTKRRCKELDAEQDAFTSLGELLVVVLDKIVHLDDGGSHIIGEDASGNDGLGKGFGAGLAVVHLGPGGHFLERSFESAHDA